MDREAFATDALRKSILFSRVPADVIGAVSGGFRARTFRRNEVIFHQGDPGDCLHVIASGSVKVLLPSAEGEEALIATLRQGDSFGELALLDGAPRSATATALEPTVTLVLPRTTFAQLLDREPALRDSLLAGLAAELRRLTRHVEELHFLDLAGRLAMRLVRLAHERDPAARGEVRLDWPYTQSDVGAMIGGTRQSVNRVLGDLIADGLVRVERRVMVITDLQRLERRADR